MRRLAHISDLHFGATNPAVVEGLIAELNRDRPDLVVASGDFTMRARPSEFRQARAFLDRLEAPWFAVPGNHDIPYYPLPSRFLRPFARYRRFIHPTTEPTFQDDEIGVIGLNTVRTWAAAADWSQGRISREQIHEAERRLSALPDHVFRIVVGHHPFMPPPWLETASVVGLAREALASFQRQGVGLALAGHLHRNYSRIAEVHGESCMQPGPGKSRLLVVQGGSATSTRLRGNEPNSYSRIIIENGNVEIQVRIWNGQYWDSLHMK